MMNPVEEFFTRRFLNLYGAPDAVDPAIFVAEYGNALAGTDVEILKAASDLVVRRHKYRNWPTVGECLDAVNTIAEQRAAQRLRTTPPQRDEREVPSKESQERVAALARETIEKMRNREIAQTRSFRDLPPVDRDAWEARFGKPRRNNEALLRALENREGCREIDHP